MKVETLIFLVLNFIREIFLSKLHDAMRAVQLHQHFKLIFTTCTAFFFLFCYVDTVNGPTSITQLGVLKM